jgi:anhydro-N-acetylmuramic acid kinase
MRFAVLFMLSSLLDKKERRIVGLMSGTSADGIDAAIIELRQKEEEAVSVSLLAFDTISFPVGLRDRILEISDPEHGRVDDICRMHFVLGELFAEAAGAVSAAAGYSMADLDLIGSHGQTIHHLPDRVELFGVKTGATLQIGDPSVIAQRTGIVTVGDFRTADIARGGQGAPLVPYVDYLLFKHTEKARGLLNIGGIANMTVLPPDAGPKDVTAFDTGPGNMVIDTVSETLTDQSIDYGGEGARRGTVSDVLVKDMLDRPFFNLSPPKSTGRELFGRSYADCLLREGRKNKMSADDLLATATEITVRSIHESYHRFVEPVTKLDELIVSGGGAKNTYLFECLAARMAPVKVMISDDYGLSSDAKEAVAFAILANQTIMGRPGNMPGATGADRMAILGKICLP